MKDTIRAFNIYLNGYLAGYKDATKDYESTESIEKDLRDVGFTDDEIEELLLTLEGEEDSLFVPRSKNLLYKFMAYALSVKECESPNDIIYLLKENGLDISVEEATEILKHKQELDI